MAIEMDGHAYPRDLAALVRERWGDRPGLPESATLGGLLSTCYQAGLMREEERAVTFRLVVSEPGSFSSEAGPPAGLHRLEFVMPRPCGKDELRRLSPATDLPQWIRLQRRMQDRTTGRLELGEGNTSTWKLLAGYQLSSHTPVMSISIPSTCWAMTARQARIRLRTWRCSGTLA